MTEQILNDRYALEQKVGEGGMAITYRARDLLLNRVVAVKLMREQFTTDPQFVERFRREAQAAACLSHENIASVYDTGRANGTYYIVMEFVEGTDLKQRLRRDGPLPLLTALEIGAQIASALEAAHRNGLVHRDIKPHNILLNKDGKVKVTDFGIAKIASDGEDTGVIIGSVHYLSPEQARGDATTPGSDLYSLGAVLFEMLTGRTVFEGENAMAVAHKQVYEQPPMPRTLRPDVPPTVEAVVMRCLEKDVRARFQSAAEVKAVLTQLMNQFAQEETVVVPTPVAPPSMDATMVYRKPVTPNEPHPARPMPEPPPAADPTPKRGRATGWVIALLFLVLTFLVTYGVFHLLSPSTPPPPPLPQLHVPDLKGLTEQEAMQMLQTKGLTGRSAHEANDQVEQGKICRQQPDADSVIDQQATVSFWVSDGPATFSMPDVTGMSFDAAKREIKNAGFTGRFSEPERISSDTVPKGYVINSDPPANAGLDRGKGHVKLLISSGPELLVAEKYSAGKVPDVGTPTTFVRIEMEKPVGSDPSVVYEGTLNKGDDIPVQTFKRKSSEHVKVSLWAGPDENSLTRQGEELFPPIGATPATTDGTKPSTGTEKSAPGTEKPAPGTDKSPTTKTTPKSTPSSDTGSADGSTQ